MTRLANHRNRPGGRKDGRARSSTRSRARNVHRRTPNRLSQGPAATRRRVRVTREVEASFEKAAALMRTSLEQLLLKAAPGSRPSPEAVLGLRTRWSGPARIPAVIEIESVGHHGRMHIRWWGRRLSRVFPVMEADLAVRSLPEGRCELVMTGEYVPPLGPIGQIGDVVFGHRVAQSTATALLDGLATTIAAADNHGGPRPVHRSEPGWGQSPLRARDHEELLTMARKVRAAAQDRDWERFGSEARRLRAELLLHLDNEVHDVGRLPTAERGLIEHGQADLISLVELLASMDKEAPGTSLAISTARLVAALDHQREQERRALSALPAA